MLDRRCSGPVLTVSGFSRSGATISTGLLLGIGKRRMEEFSFALAVVLTPPVIARESLRLFKAHSEATQPSHLVHLALPGLAWYGLQFCGRVAGALVTVTMVRVGPLEAFWLLLSGCSDRCLWTGFCWVLNGSAVYSFFL